MKINIYHATVTLKPGATPTDWGSFPVSVETAAKDKHEVRRQIRKSVSNRAYEITNIVKIGEVEEDD